MERHVEAQGSVSWPCEVTLRVNWWREYKVKLYKQPNYTLHPASGGRLGADFVRTFARRG